MQPVATLAGQVVLDRVFASHLCLKMILEGCVLFLGERCRQMDDVNFAGGLQPQVVCQRCFSHAWAVHAVVNDDFVVCYDNTADMRVGALRENLDRQAIALTEDQ